MKHIAEAFLPTKFGEFKVHAFQDKKLEHIVLIACSGSPHDGVPVRIHSRCLTGDTLGSLRCDCRDQLEKSLGIIQKNKCGILIYLDQEGRGIGLSNKIKAYALQDSGLDTVEANIKLGFKEDMRNYKPAAEILTFFGIKEISLITNNPTKIAAIQDFGIIIRKRIPIVTRTNKFNKSYIKTKKEKMGHQF